MPGTRPYRKWEGGQRPPSLSKAVVVDSINGKLRLRAWPRPRGQNRHPTNTYWTRWLKAATYMYRYQPAKVQAQLQAATKGTPWMPRDIFIAAMRGRAWLLTDENGRHYYPMAMRQDVSESLDALAQVPGQMLFRASGLWVPVPPGTNGQILTYQDEDNPPLWQDASGGGGGGSWQLLEQTVNSGRASQIEFQGLDSDTYRLFRLTILAQRDGTTGDDVELHINNSFATDYSYGILRQTGTTVDATDHTNENHIGLLTGSEPDDGMDYQIVIYISKPRASRHALVQSVATIPHTAPAQIHSTGVWANTSDLITEISFENSGFAQFAPDGIYTLEGLPLDA